MNFVIALDMEGVHGVVGEPYKGLSSDSDEYKKAVISATCEVNEAVKALFDAGAEKVYIWDNHGAKDNIFTDLIDSRAEKIILPVKTGETRLDFLKDIKPQAAIIYLGYHAREGSFNGVLCHTFNSVAYQYIKFDGKPVGELDIDAEIASTLKVPSVFAASDDVCISQVKAYDERITTVVTKYGKGRNAADFRPVQDVLKDIYDGVKYAASNVFAPKNATFPKEVEIRYTRIELAAHIYETLNGVFGKRICYGDDSHILKFTVNDVDELRKIL